VRQQAATEAPSRPAATRAYVLLHRRPLAAVVCRLPPFAPPFSFLPFSSSCCRLLPRVFDPSAAERESSEQIPGCALLNASKGRPDAWNVRPARLKLNGGVNGEPPARCLHQREGGAATSNVPMHQVNGSGGVRNPSQSGRWRARAVRKRWGTPSQTPPRSHRRTRRQACERLSIVNLPPALWWRCCRRHAATRRDRMLQPPSRARRKAVCAVTTGQVKCRVVHVNVVSMSAVKKAVAHVQRLKAGIPCPHGKRERLRLRRAGSSSSINQPRQRGDGSELCCVGGGITRVGSEPSARQERVRQVMSLVQQVW